DLAGRELWIGATWWIASKQLMPFVIVGALAVLWRTRRVDVGLVFYVVAAGATIIALVDINLDSADMIVQYVAYSSPLIFIAGFMVTEPLTLPPRRFQQWTVAAVTALVFAWPLYYLVFG